MALDAAARSHAPGRSPARAPSVARKRSGPGQSTLLGLQRNAGNRAVGGLIQRVRFANLRGLGALYEPGGAAAGGEVGGGMGVVTFLNLILVPDSTNLNRLYQAVQAALAGGHPNASYTPVGAFAPVVLPIAAAQAKVTEHRQKCVDQFPELFQPDTTGIVGFVPANPATWDFALSPQHITKLTALLTAPTVVERHGFLGQSRSKVTLATPMKRAPAPGRLPQNVDTANSTPGSTGEAGRSSCSRSGASSTWRLTASDARTTRRCSAARTSRRPARCESRTASSRR
jgi:hypothetical protein